MSTPASTDAAGNPPTLDWSQMPKSAAAWLSAGLFDAAGLP